MSKRDLKGLLLGRSTLAGHPQAGPLVEIVTGETGLSSSGFPYLSDRSFRLFVQRVPHLFADGQTVLDWLDALGRELDVVEGVGQDALASARRALKVLQTVVFTAGVTAPPDLWVVRQVLGTHQALGTLNWFLEGRAVVPETYAQERGLDAKRLNSDLHLLHARGYLDRGDGDFWAPGDPEVVAVLEGVQPLPDEQRANLVPAIVGWLSGEAKPAQALLEGWLAVGAPQRATGNWVASLLEVELGYRVLPLVLALRVLALTAALQEGVRLAEAVPRWLPAMGNVFERAGLTRRGAVTKLGARVFERGPGPFGIIGAYHPYLSNLEALLRGDGSVSAWVRRGENVAASQDANRKTFEAANDRLDAFCRDYGFGYEVFVEHAVGQGEAIRQRHERDGPAPTRYFGADLEPQAIEQAKAQQRQGLLPPTLEFICPADIGQPQRVIDYLKAQGLLGRPTVMMVGNGFHEVRNQTNEKMIEVFRAYQEAGFVLIFTEESALNDEALRHTAWNTYHAGFRYVHELSGQGLRPARGTGAHTRRWSWRRCASLGGYLVLEAYSYRTRTIYPYPRPKHRNPAISETFFCVPYKLALALGVVE